MSRMFDFYNNYGLTYNESFAYQFACTALFYGAIAFVASYLFYLTSTFLKRSIKSKQASSIKSVEENQELDLDLDSSFHNIRTSLREEENASKDSKVLAVTVFNGLTLLGSWYALLSIAVTPAILSGLGVISTFSAFLLTLIIFLAKFISMVYWYCPTFLKKKTLGQYSMIQVFWRKVTITTKLYNVRFGMFIGLAVVYSIVVPLLTRDTCLNFYNEGYGSNYQGIGVSTRFSRYFQLNTVCPEGQVCQLYTTLAEDAATSFILNVHTGTDVSSIVIKYDLDTQGTLEKSVTAQSYFVDLEERGARYVHSAYIENLEPNTLYKFEVFYNDKVQKTGTYRTLPTEKMERNIVIAAGGDAGTTKNAKTMTSILGGFDPDAIIVGGDISYDNGMKSCYYSMDLFIRMFDDVNAQVKRLVPLIFSVGNHDIGFNAFQDGVIDVTENMYYIFFPQETIQTKENKRILPDIKDRKTYYYHTLGNTVHLSLDSGYMLSYDGEQTTFIEDISKKFHDRVKMVNFHVPMYPACFNALYDDPRTIDHPKQYWAPLFEKHKVASVFENHVHLYKKTFSLVNDKKVPDGEGVVYFGDGNWGISPNSCQKDPNNLNTTGHLEAYDNSTHVWIVEISPTKLSHFAVNLDGEVFDKVYDLPVEKYIS